MTLLDDTTTTAFPPAERAERLAAAGAAWADRIERSPDAAHLTYTVTGRGTGAVASAITAGRHRFELAGDDVAASPVEYALGALISCQIVVYRLYAGALGIQLDDIEITAEGDLDARKLFGIDESVRAGFNQVRLTVKLHGPESSERYEALRETVDAHCPVLDLFANPVPTTVVLG
ncbi:putative OsmC-like protein [Agromyces hippuratus]|uniref:Putative OsmC-like protein n=1 Tax=Agromyces hippuratus TaxID=286438 RepID=A0A852WYU8_9MICO|nr:OsmC family protein [Agromyces hippuratus]NYG21410.1 putative OsmC-like protein [Agromyces hippuratus]